MTRRLAAAAAVLLGTGTPLAARTDAPAAPPPIVVERPRPVHAVEAAPSGSPWEACAFVLEGPDGRTAERSLSAICRGAAPGGAPEMRALVSGLAGARALAADPLGDGRVRVLVGVVGGVRSFLLGATGEPPVEAGSLSDARLDPASLADRPDLDGDGTRDLLQATWEGLTAWRWTGNGFAPLAEAALPRRAAAGGGDVSVWSPLVIAGDAIPVPRWTRPANWTGERLRLERIELGSNGAGPSCSAWIAPGSRVQAAAAAVLGGDRPRLVALVEPAERIALLGERRLLVAPLICRASGRGEPPAQLLDTPLANYFANATLLVRDATGDGLDDVLAIGISGRLKPDLEVLVWPGEAGGGLARRPLRWSRKAETMGGTWSFAEDVDGDGLPDLVRREERALWLARGLSPGPGRIPLETTPAFTGALPEEYAAAGPVGRLLPRAAHPGEPAWLLFTAQRAAKEGSAPAHALIVVPVPVR
jgi:hypothetical protein